MRHPCVCMAALHFLPRLTRVTAPGSSVLPSRFEPHPLARVKDFQQIGANRTRSTISVLSGRRSTLVGNAVPVIVALPVCAQRNAHRQKEMRRMCAPRCRPRSASNNSAAEPRVRPPIGAIALESLRLSLASTGRGPGRDDIPSGTPHRAPSDDNGHPGCATSRGRSLRQL